MKKIASDYSKLQKVYGKHAKKIAMRLQQLSAAYSLQIYAQLDPLARLHQLTGDRDGPFAVEITGNFRLIFEIANTPIPRTDEGEEIDRSRVTKIKVIELSEDYHG